MTSQEKLRLLALFTGIVVAAIVGIYYWDQEAFESWKENIHPAYFALLLATLPCVGIPTTPFYLVAGASFPFWTAILVCALGIAGSNLISWWVARKLMRKRLQRILARWTKQPLQDNNPHKWDAALLIKFVPGLPGFARNYGLALSGLSFFEYLFFNAGVSTLFALALILLGESFTERNWVGVLVGILFLVLLFVAVRLVRKFILSRSQSDSASN